MSNVLTYVYLMCSIVYRYRILKMPCPPRKVRKVAPGLLSLPDHLKAEIVNCLEEPAEKMKTKLLCRDFVDIEERHDSWTSVDWVGVTIGGEIYYLGSLSQPRVHIELPTRKEQRLFVEFLKRRLSQPVTCGCLWPGGGGDLGKEFDNLFRSMGLSGIVKCLHLHSIDDSRAMEQGGECITSVAKCVGDLSVEIRKPLRSLEPLWHSISLCTVLTKLEVILVKFVDKSDFFEALANLSSLKSLTLTRPQGRRMRDYPTVGLEFDVQDLMFVIACLPSLRRLDLCRLKISFDLASAGFLNSSPCELPLTLCGAFHHGDNAAPVAVLLTKMPKLQQIGFQYSGVKLTSEETHFKIAREIAAYISSMDIYPFNEQW